MAPLLTKPLLAALRGIMPARVPIWLMRQAGRYLPEYRAIRAAAGSFLELCYTPELAAEITLQPVRRYAMDAAILFSDILVVPDGLGCEVAFVEGQGPQLRPVRDAVAVAGLGAGALHQRLAPVYETVRQVADRLPPEVALIGFAGAPWTVAAYMVEGGGSKEFHHARRFARRDPQAFARLIDLLVEATADYLVAQIRAGAEVVQLFDSWAGVLPEPEMARWCLEPARRIVARVHAAAPEVPVIVFPRGVGASYAGFAATVGAEGIGLDTTVPLAWARRELGGVCLQGNLDPVALLGPRDALRAEVRRIGAALAGRAFIFNLGHGVLPDTDPDAVAAVVDEVRALPVASG
jgi:uroporphyrinogen decarboxylase